MHGAWLGDDRVGLSGARIADIFCGTGALGFEAISRGGVELTLLDRDTTMLGLACANAKMLGIAVQAVRADARSLPTAALAHDLVLMDPPYDFVEIEAVMVALLRGGWVTRGGLVVIERSQRDKLRPSMPDGFSLLRQRQVGAASIWLIRAPSI